jgi:hypothetical protein
MKAGIQYVSDSKGNTKSVQIPLSEWERLLSKLKKYEQTFKLRSDLKQAFKQVASLKKATKKQSLKEFINGL